MIIILGQPQADIPCGMICDPIKVHRKSESYRVQRNSHGLGIELFNSPDRWTCHTSVDHQLAVTGKDSTWIYERRDPKSWRAIGIPDRFDAALDSFFFLNFVTLFQFPSRARTTYGVRRRALRTLRADSCDSWRALRWKWRVCARRKLADESIRHWFLSKRCNTA